MAVLWDIFVSLMLHFLDLRNTFWIKEPFSLFAYIIYDNLTNHCFFHMGPRSPSLSFSLPGHTLLINLNMPKAPRQLRIEYSLCMQVYRLLGKLTINAQ